MNSNSARAEKPKVLPFDKKKAVEPEISWTPKDFLPAGNYRAYSRSARLYRDEFYQRWVCVIHFDIVDTALVSIANLDHYLNLGRGERAHAGRRSNFWQAYILANGSAPKRGDRISPKIFEHRYCQVQVADVTKDSRGVVTNCPDHSKVTKILAWETGR